MQPDITSTSAEGAKKVARLASHGLEGDCPLGLDASVRVGVRHEAIAMGAVPARHSTDFSGSCRLARGFRDTRLRHVEGTQRGGLHH